jgi:hypothetical protein
MNTYHKHARFLADSRLSDVDLRRLYFMDSTTITLFKDILRGIGRNPKEGIQAHNILKASENVPRLIRYSEALRHEHMFLEEVHNLAAGSRTEEIGGRFFATILSALCALEVQTCPGF